MHQPRAAHAAIANVEHAVRGHAAFLRRRAATITSPRTASSAPRRRDAAAQPALEYARRAPAASRARRRGRREVRRLRRGQRDARESAARDDRGMRGRRRARRAPRSTVAACRTRAAVAARESSAAGAIVEDRLRPTRASCVALLSQLRRSFANAERERRDHVLASRPSPPRRSASRRRARAERAGT